MAGYYEKVFTRIPKKDFRTREERFMSGEDRIEIAYETLKSPERGQIKGVVDIIDIHKMIRGNHSIVEVMKKYGIQSRNTVYKILGLEIPVFSQSAGQKEENQLTVSVASMHRVAKKCLNLDDKEVAELVSAYNMGIPTYIIANKHGLKQTQIRTILRKNGVEMSKSRPRIQRLSQEEKVAIDNLYNSGISPEDISEQMSIDTDQVRRYIRRTFCRKV